MVKYLKRKSSFSSCKCWWYRLGLPVTILLVICILLGCSSTTPTQLYEYSELGIKLESPENWSVDYYERNGSIVLKAASRSPNRNSARIDIFGSTCSSTLFNPPDEALEYNIDRIRRLYDLDSITIIQEPKKFEAIDKEIVNATIQIPTTSLPEDSPGNQVGERSPNVFQVIDIFAIKYSNDELIMVYVYKGNSEQLNAEAEGIVDSIQSTCSSLH